MGRFLHKALVGYAFSRSIRGVGYSLVAVFVPLILLKKGFELWQVGAVYSGIAAVQLLIEYPCLKLVNYFGVRVGFLAGSIAAALNMVMLTWYIADSTAEYALGGVIIAQAIHQSLLSHAEHLYVADAIDLDRKATDLSRIDGMMRLVACIVPFFGALIAVLLGQVWLTAIAAILLIGSVFPVWRDRDIRGNQRKSSIRFRQRKAPITHQLACLGQYLHLHIGLMVWPVYLAVLMPSFRSVGVVTTTASLIAIAVLLWSGRRSDRGKGNRVLVEGAGGVAVVHIARIFIGANPIVLMISSVLFDLARNHHIPPWLGEYYMHAKREGIRYMLSMQLACTTGIAVAWGTLTLAAYLLSAEWAFMICFGLAAIAAWLTPLIRVGSFRDR